MIGQSKIVGFVNSSQKLKVVCRFLQINTCVFVKKLKPTNLLDLFLMPTKKYLFVVFFSKLLFFTIFLKVIVCKCVDEYQKSHEYLEIFVQTICGI